MKPYQDSLDDSEDRSVDWKYTGRFLQFGELTYKLPSTGKPSKYECVRRTTKNQMIDGTLILPIVRGSVYTEPHILLIRCYRPALESYVLSLPAGLVDKNENPEDAALRELQEETGFIGKLSECQFDIPYYSDPWKSNEQQRLFIVEIDVDEMSNKSPHQQLEEDESISTMIVPISKLSEFIQSEESKGIIVSTSIFFVAAIMSNSFSL